MLHLGVASAPDSTTRRKVLLCNVGAFIGIGSALLYDAVYVYSGSASARLAAYAHLPSYLVFLLVLWLNHHRHYYLASWTLMLGAMYSTLAPILLVFGTYLDHHHYFILKAVAPVAFISTRLKPTVALMFVLNAGLFIFFSLNERAPAPDILLIDNDIVTVFRTLLSFLVILSIGIFFWAFDIYTGRSERELSALSMTDSLTSLPNRRHLENVFHHEMRKAQRSQAPMAVALMDIDRFKTINDTWGHHVGDAVICEVAAAVRRNLRVGSMVGRMGGDELMVLMPETSLAVAAEVMERVRAAVAVVDCECDGARLRATVSIGVAQVAADDSITEAFVKADGMLYAAKQAGRNAVKH